MYTQLEIDILQLFFMSILTSYHMVAKQKFLLLKGIKQLIHTILHFQMQ